LEWLGTRRLSWRDLLVIVKQAPRTSAIRRAQLGDEAEWGLAEQLSAANHDLLAWLKWAQTEDGAKGLNHPEPLPRPGVKPSEDRMQTGGEAADLVDIDEWLAKRNPAQHPPAADA
jgi:hypothetical protein